jgi:hypothetical protein
MADKKISDLDVLSPAGDSWLIGTDNADINNFKRFQAQDFFMNLAEEQGLVKSKTFDFSTISSADWVTIIKNQSGLSKYNFVIDFYVKGNSYNLCYARMFATPGVKNFLFVFAARQLNSYRNLLGVRTISEGNYLDWKIQIKIDPALSSKNVKVYLASYFMLSDMQYIDIIDTIEQGLPADYSVEQQIDFDTSKVTEFYLKSFTEI